MSEHNVGDGDVKVLSVNIPSLEHVARISFWNEYIPISCVSHL